VATRWGWGLVALAGVAVVAALAALSTESGLTVPEIMRAAGCTYRAVKPLPPKPGSRDDYHQDVPSLTAPARWATFPPSGGSHYRLWAPWGFYRKAVNPRLVVHNEEHGGVVIWWGPDVPAATVDRLEAFYRSSPVAVFGTPIAGLGSRIALTAWNADPRWKGEPGLAYRRVTSAPAGSPSARTSRRSTWLWTRRSRRGPARPSPYRCP
jgi:Protein of unknown function (DUF3105)